MVWRKNEVSDWTVKASNSQNISESTRLIFTITVVTKIFWRINSYSVLFLLHIHNTISWYMCIYLNETTMRMRLFAWYVRLFEWNSTWMRRAFIWMRRTAICMRRTSIWMTHTSIWMKHKSIWIHVHLIGTSLEKNQLLFTNRQSQLFLSNCFKHYRYSQRTFG